MNDAKTKVIYLTNGGLALVDAQDFESLSAHTWHDREGYICRWEGRKLVRMHREVLGLTKHDPRRVDHENGKRYDNRRSNLRIATSVQNGANQAVKANSTTGLKGATYHKRVGKFQASIRVDGKRRHLGYFATAEAAHAAYVAASQEGHGEFHRPCEPSPHWWEGHAYRSLRLAMRNSTKRLKALLGEPRTAENGAALEVEMKVSAERSNALGRFVLDATAQYGYGN
ncbi:hypothetical protein [Paraburkholderia aromaticivorans]|uniref:hypothetical protein n=1 Tax=Paraburkholderia aromaticivorans TaxID=2026199 RepID=UPI0014562386|nr:hypothetical protein [Paraburkholderia aromaticivorans]